MKEYWKPVRGFEKSYSISNLARIRSHINTGTDNYLKTQSLDKEGNLRTYLYNGIKHLERKVSRLMVEAFYEETRSWIEVVYKDGNKSNCRLDNLGLKIPHDQ